MPNVPFRWPFLLPIRCGRGAEVAANRRFRSGRRVLAYGSAVGWVSTKMPAETRSPSLALPLRETVRRSALTLRMISPTSHSPCRSTAICIRASGSRADSNLRSPFADIAFGNLAGSVTPRRRTPLGARGFGSCLTESYAQAMSFRSWLRPVALMLAGAFLWGAGAFGALDLGSVLSRIGELIGIGLLATGAIDLALRWWLRRGLSRRELNPYGLVGFAIVVVVAVQFVGMAVSASDVSPSTRLIDVFAAVAVAATVPKLLRLLPRPPS